MPDGALLPGNVQTILSAYQGARGGVAALYLLVLPQNRTGSWWVNGVAWCLARGCIGGQDLGGGGGAGRDEAECRAPHPHHILHLPPPNPHSFRATKSSGDLAHPT